VKKLITTANIRRKTSVWEQPQNRPLIVEIEVPDTKKLREIVKRGAKCVKGVPPAGGLDAALDKADGDAGLSSGPQILLPVI